MGATNGCCGPKHPNFDTAWNTQAKTESHWSQSHQSFTYEQIEEKADTESSKTTNVINDTITIHTEHAHKHNESLRNLEDNKETEENIKLSDNKTRNSYEDEQETKTNIDGVHFEAKYNKPEKKKRKKKHKNKLVSTLKECIKEINESVENNVLGIIGKDMSTNIVNMEQLDVREICRHFKTNKYDIEWFLITPRNKFIIIIVNKWSDISILTAITIYESLRVKLHNIIPSVTKSTLYLLTDMESKNKRKKSEENIVFTWNNIKYIKECECNQLLYIVSLIIKKENQEILKSNTLQPVVGKRRPLYAQKDILMYLLEIKMNGRLFKGINKDIMYTNMYKFVIEINDRIDENDDFAKQYITDLYSKIDEYDVTMIKKQKVCTIQFTWSRSQRLESVTSLIKTMQVSMSLAMDDEEDDDYESSNYSESIQLHDDDDEKLKPLEDSKPNTKTKIT